MKKWSLAHICAYISLVISITLLVLWCCNVGGFTVVSLDSFVGVIVALLAIIVTMAVGWQIYNSIELKQRIGDLDVLKDALQRQEKTIEQQTCKSQHLISLILGTEAIKEKQHLESFRFFMSSLKYDMQLETPLNVEHLLKRLELIANKIDEGTSFEFDRLKDVRDYNESIRVSSHYSLIKNQYEKIYNEFNAKVKESNHE